MTPTALLNPTRPTVTVSELLKLVDPRWHAAFVQFIETGDAEAGFLSYLDRDENCQKAVETAFRAQAAALEDLARALNRHDAAPNA